MLKTMHAQSYGAPSHTTLRVEQLEHKPRATPRMYAQQSACMPLPARAPPPALLDCYTAHATYPSEAESNGDAEDALGLCLQAIALPHTRTHIMWMQVAMQPHTPIVTTSN